MDAAWQKAGRECRRFIRFLALGADDHVYRHRFVLLDRLLVSLENLCSLSQYCEVTWLPNASSWSQVQAAIDADDEKLLVKLLQDFKGVAVDQGGLQQGTISELIRWDIYQN